jgi:hypothetical protein
MLRRLNDGAVIDVDDDALDENGLLRDGHRMRVPMEFRGIAGGRRRRGRCALPTAAPMHRSERGFITTADSEAVRRAAYERGFSSCLIGEPPRRYKIWWQVTLKW